jgi:hypothetical protein
VPSSYIRVNAAADLKSTYSGMVARVDLRDFQSVETLDLAGCVDDDLRGFQRGFGYKHFVFLVPHRARSYAPADPSQFSGKLVRIDTRNFTAAGVSVLDLSAALRSQVPDYADRELRGFRGGFVSGKYGFFVPFFSGAVYSGKVCRINLDKFDEVQALDLSMMDDRLRGFADGVVSGTQQELDVDLFGEFQMRLGTSTPYEYIY